VLLDLVEPQLVPAAVALRRHAAPPLARRYGPRLLTAATLLLAAVMAGTAASVAASTRPWPLLPWLAVAVGGGAFTAAVFAQILAAVRAGGHRNAFGHALLYQMAVFLAAALTAPLHRAATRRPDRPATPSSS
jgi:hypothetical protein